MNNKLDSFNKDKTKCKKCKEYFDAHWSCLCEDCYKKWATRRGLPLSRSSRLCSIEDWCKLVQQTNNKLDTFNKDKTKCKKCKKYYDKIGVESKVFIHNGIKTLMNADLCEDCNVMWAEKYWTIVMNWKYGKSNFENWCNNEQT